ncbi:dynein light chain Tctex-type 5-like [Argopecten irradians]|uniref:dynein light chain Tctex-type 5-like n=1 Tax=Argopecten irradians TaxID=31199 RepID=UPI0037226703
MASQEMREDLGDQPTSFFKTALTFEDYKGGSPQNSRDASKPDKPDKPEPERYGPNGSKKHTDLGTETKNLPALKSDVSDQNAHTMLNKMTAHIRVQSPALVSALKSDVKPESEKLYRGPQTNKLLSVFGREKSTSSQDGDSSAGNMMQMIKLRNIARNVKHIQQDRQKRLENTGNVTIYDRFRKFDHKEAEESMRFVLQSSLEHVVYEPKRCKVLSLQLSDTIRNTIKRMKFPRYKFVSFVTIGQKGNPNVVVASRCVWNTDDDSFASVTYENKTLFANAVVFAMLHE